jgi:pyruvate,water dikinase
LAQLHRLGLRVPEGFVIVGATPGNLPPDLDERSAQLAGAVAVRSSAVGEDSADASFAGQFESVLNVQGATAIRVAVEHCLASAAAARVEAYRNGVHAQGEVRMSVLVQRMVSATCAGVIFTADPVTGQRDRVVVHAVPGLGEALVGGYRTPDRFVLSRDGAVLERAVQGGQATVDDPLLAQLLQDALKAESALGYPLDLEWALGSDARVCWLQARPITTLDLPGPDELDDPVDPTWQITSYNVAEWMPGAMPPLSWSVVGPSYVAAISELYVRAGLSREQVDRVPILVNVQGHAFINMTNFYLLGSQMFGMDKDSSDLTLTGQVLPQAKLPPEAPALQRLLHTVRYFRLIPAGRKRLNAFVERHSGFRVEPTEDLMEYCRRLDQARAVFYESGAVHVQTSLMAMAFLGLFQRLLSRGGPPTASSHAAVAALLAGAKSDAPKAAESSIGPADALDFLGTHRRRARGGGAIRTRRPPRRCSGCATRLPHAGEAFSAFLKAHGHRCIRELDFRERDWSEDPIPLVQSLQRIASAPPAAKTGWAREAQAALAELSWGARRLIHWLLPKAHTEIVERERSKSFSVWLARQLKRGYVDFAKRVTEGGCQTRSDLLLRACGAGATRAGAGSRPGAPCGTPPTAACAQGRDGVPARVPG